MSGIFLVLTLAMLTLHGCSHPIRFDPHRGDLERQQEQCLARGGNPQECRP